MGPAPRVVYATGGGSDGLSASERDPRTSLRKLKITP